MLQFPQLSVGGQYPYSPMTGCSSPCTSSKPHLVPQCLIHGGGGPIVCFPSGVPEAGPMACRAVCAWCGVRAHGAPVWVGGDSRPASLLSNISLFWLNDPQG